MSHFFMFQLKKTMKTQQPSSSQPAATNCHVLSADERGAATALNRIALVGVIGQVPVYGGEADNFQFVFESI